MLLIRSRRSLAALALAAILFSGFFERAFALLARFSGWPQGLSSLWEANGSSLDPNGGPTSNGDRGSSLDPNG